ncbi:MAG: radical SAM protein [bacterium]|nr:radical SAM protein [bacterium]
MDKKNEKEQYNGFEQGPIRPPSEAYSLLIRVTRNCAWNRCTFCPVYKGSRFSLRPVEHVTEDIDAVYRCLRLLQKTGESTGTGGYTPGSTFDTVFGQIEPSDSRAFQAAVNWLKGGKRSIFIQDADSPTIKPAYMIRILQHLGLRFPDVERITSYARSHTMARLQDNDLKAMADAGLNRIHIGMESGSDRVLEKVKKGVTKDIHIKAGLKVKKAGMQLSEYVMPGLGGRELSRHHALETADALSRINPHFIRLRTLALPETLELYKDYAAGTFTKNTEVQTVEEILLFLENLENIDSVVQSDHMLNLFQSVEGKLPQDKEKMTGILKRFLDMEPAIQCRYLVGSRLGLYSCVEDMQDPMKASRVDQACDQLQVTPENVDDVITEIMKRFV